VLSRAALAIVAQDGRMTECREKMLCDGGDVRVAACMGTYGVQVEYLPKTFDVPDRSHTVRFYREPCDAAPHVIRESFSCHKRDLLQAAHAERSLAKEFWEGSQSAACAAASA
jgi:hypothetical protein